MEELIDVTKEPVRVEIVHSPDELTKTKESDDWNWVTKVVAIAVAIVFACASFFVIAPVASSPDTYQKTISVLDEKQENAVALTATAAAASALVSMAPDDWGDAVSEELAGLSSDLAIITMAILLEKYLLTIFGLVSFRVLIPAACVIVIVGALFRRVRNSMIANAVKVIAFALVLCLIVPAGAGLSGMIDDIYDTSAAVRIATEQVDNGAQVVEEEDASDQGFFNKLKSAATDAGETITNATSEAVNNAKNSLNNLLEAFAVMVVTTCVIPILVALVALWAAGTLFKIDVSKPMGMMKSRSWRGAVISARGKIKERLSEN